MYSESSLLAFPFEIGFFFHSDCVGFYTHIGTSNIVVTFTLDVIHRFGLVSCCPHIILSIQTISHYPQNIAHMQAKRISNWRITLTLVDFVGAFAFVYNIILLFLPFTSFPRRICYFITLNRLTEQSVDIRSSKRP